MHDMMDPYHKLTESNRFLICPYCGNNNDIPNKIKGVGICVFCDEEFIVVENTHIFYETYKLERGEE